jgi:hypothetical protein
MSNFGNLFKKAQDVGGGGQKGGGQRSADSSGGVQRKVTIKGLIIHTLL